MKKISRILLITITVIAVIWTILTLWVEQTGPKKSWESGNAASEKNVLIVYDPDPFYNLDEQVCKSVAQAFAESGMKVTVATVAAARELIANNGGSIIGSRSFWLMRPNDETRMNESNVKVANSMVYEWALGVGKQITW